MWDIERKNYNTESKFVDVIIINSAFKKLKKIDYSNTLV